MVGGRACFGSETGGAKGGGGPIGRRVIGRTSCDPFDARGCPNNLTPQLVLSSMSGFDAISFSGVLDILVPTKPADQLDKDAVLDDLEGEQETTSGKWNVTGGTSQDWQHSILAGASCP